jgi:hypothetical protein
MTLTSNSAPSSKELIYRAFFSGASRDRTDDLLLAKQLRLPHCVVL